MTPDPKGPPIGVAAASVARAVNVSALLQALAVGALPTETIEGLLVAAETAILVQLAVGTLSREGAAELRRKAAEWSLETADQMEKDGTADEMRKHHAEAIEEYNKARSDDGNNMN